MDNILAEDPDLVIMATGVVPIMPQIPGLKKALTGKEVLTNKEDVGKRVLIIGGGMVGPECAEFLARRGPEITVVELSEDVARDMDPITEKLTIKQLNESKVKTLTDTKIVRFEGKKAFIGINEKEKILGEFDSVIVAAGTKSIDNLIDPLRERGIDVKVIGDARKPGQIYDAVKDGFEIAMSI